MFLEPPRRMSSSPTLVVLQGGRVRELIEGRGCELFCTGRPTRRASIGSKKPSPRSRASLEKSEARTREALLEALLEALGAAISAVTAKDARLFGALWVPCSGSIVLIAAVVCKLPSVICGVVRSFSATLV